MNERIHYITFHYITPIWDGGHRGRDRMVVGFTTTCAISAYHTKVVSSNPVYCEVYSIHHYVIKFDSDLLQVGSFLLVLRFPPPIS